MNTDAATNAAKLARINALDAVEPRGLLRSVLLKVGPQPWFIAIYRRLGPKIDPTVSRIRDGAVMRSLYGLPGMVLHTTGAKSGQPRSNPLLYARDGDDFIVVGTNFGQLKHPAWTANLRAHPDAAVEIGGITLPVTAHIIEGDEWQSVFDRLVAIYPGYALYLERRSELPPRLFRLVPKV
ncbi:MAG: nitroreductase family deazaflavin-dependent oxidoreductase [Actinobacteria bacterium]|nr:nitroreductase family deazaflavin-dependent oxidoreductase [Actinomycetota bacterium]